MSIFDKFFNASTKLQPVVEPELNDAVPGTGGKILSDAITQKLALRHQLMMTAARGKSDEADEEKFTVNANKHDLNGRPHHPPHEKHFGNEVEVEDAEVEETEDESSDDDDDGVDRNEKLETERSGSESDGDDDDEKLGGDTSLFSASMMVGEKTDSNSLTMNSWKRKGGGDDDFLVFGSAKANALRGAVNTSKAVEMSEAEHYMAPVAAFTFVSSDSTSALKNTSKQKGADLARPESSEQQQKQQLHEAPATRTFRVNSAGAAAASLSSDPKMVSINTCVPLWAAHRYVPRSLLSRPSTASVVGEDGDTAVVVKDTNLKMQLVSPTPINKREAAAVRNYLNGYSPIDSIALHQEILDFYDYIRPTEAEVVLRRFIETQISNIAKALFSGCEPIVYGSLTTGLLLPYSDIDMSILNVTTCSVEDGLLSLQKQITLNELCEGHAPQVILKTRVPLIKFTSSIAPLDVDVSINASDGQRNSEWVAKMLTKFPESKYLIVLVKYFLNQRDMNEPYRGGIGSFAATLLVLSFLQHHPIYTTDCPNRKHYGLGRLFSDFLQYYGSLGFNTERIGISLRIAEMGAAGCFFQRDAPNFCHRLASMPGKGPTKMDIEDPVTTDNNAASSVRLVQMAQSSFEGALLLLTARAPALNSLLAPAHLFPSRQQLYQPPTLHAHAQSSQFRALFEGVDPVNDHVLKRPTLLSRILHHDVALVEKRITIQDAFNRFQRDQISKEGQLFKEVLATVKKSKLFQQTVEIKTRNRYDADEATSPQAKDKKEPNHHIPFHHKLVPHSPFALGYDQQAHVEYFKQRVAELVKDHKMALLALSHTQTAKISSSSSSAPSSQQQQQQQQQQHDKEQQEKESGKRRQRYEAVVDEGKEVEQQRQEKSSSISLPNKKSNVSNVKPQQQVEQPQQQRRGGKRVNNKKSSDDDDEDDDESGGYASWQRRI